MLYASGYADGVVRWGSGSKNDSLDADSDEADAVVISCKPSPTGCGTANRIHLVSGDSGRQSALALAADGTRVFVTGSNDGQMFEGGAAVSPSQGGAIGSFALALKASQFTGASNWFEHTHSEADATLPAAGDHAFTGAVLTSQGLFVAGYSSAPFGLSDSNGALLADVDCDGDDSCADGHLLRLDPETGAPQWVLPFRNPSSQTGESVVDVAAIGEDVVAIGNFSGGLVVGTKSLVSTPNALEAFAGRIGPGDAIAPGDARWLAKFETDRTIVCQSVAATTLGTSSATDDRVAVTCAHRGSAALVGPSGARIEAPANPLPNSNATVVGLLTGAGEPIWLHRFSIGGPGDDPNGAVAFDDRGDVLLVAAVTNHVIWDDRPIVDLLAENDVDTLLMKIDAQTGAPVWYRVLSGASSQAGRSVIFDPLDKRGYVVGSFAGQLLLPSKAGPVSTGIDAFVLRFDPSGGS